MKRALMGIAALSLVLGACGGGGQSAECKTLIHKAAAANQKMHRDTVNIASISVAALSKDMGTLRDTVNAAQKCR